ncbi:hypothetical protein [Rhizobium sp. S163]|uniref:hypothetical protein n=1 Tax=Rhizobium sp. S163 TaxID=3055039 RepID=UPI0025A9456A|nr:hypothetical protein [Rhizobium sp. S163]MDM9646357.1 hypothetical protein [Rhizobium sp. S163]
MRANRLQGNRWIATAVGGLFLIALGIVLGADQLGYVLPYRWASLILLVPAFSAITDGVRIAGGAGWRSVAASTRFVTGAIFATIGISLALRLNTGLILPGLIVGLGIVTTMRALSGKLL